MARNNVLIRCYNLLPDRYFSFWMHVSPKIIYHLFKRVSAYTTSTTTNTACAAANIALASPFFGIGSRVVLVRVVQQIAPEDDVSPMNVVGV